MIEHAFNLKIGSIIDKLVSLVKLMQQQDKLQKLNRTTKNKNKEKIPIFGIFYLQYLFRLC